MNIKLSFIYHEKHEESSSGPVIEVTLSNSDDEYSADSLTFWKPSTAFGCMADFECTYHNTFNNLPNFIIDEIADNCAAVWANKSPQN